MIDEAAGRRKVWWFGVIGDQIHGLAARGHDAVNTGTGWIWVGH
jgi:hypothetical protein